MPILRILLLPFTFLYTAVTDFRNLLYDAGIKKTSRFDSYVISVGNLTAGGTGKTPFVEHIINSLKSTCKMAVLSRGYKRKTSGFRLADSTDNAETLGDEPFQYFSKFGDEITVAVGEKRAPAIKKLTAGDQEIDVVVLDDAYQHRSVVPNLNILLNDYLRPFYKDSVLPTGLLRESRKHAGRADVVAVTKCPAELPRAEMSDIKNRIRHYAGNNVPVFFTSIRYLQPVAVFGKLLFEENVVLFSGIANADPLEEFVRSKYNLLFHKRYPDHYSFKEKDLKELTRIFDGFEIANKCLLTTEKDMMRLISMKDQTTHLRVYPVFYLPIELYFLESGDLFADYLNRKVSEGIKAVGLS